MPVELGTYLTNGKKLVQVIAVDSTVVLGKSHPLYICEDVSVSCEVAAPIVKLSAQRLESRKGRDPEWKEVEHGKAPAQAPAG
jgi:hypothetical protein